MPFGVITKEMLRKIRRREKKVKQVPTYKVANVVKTVINRETEKKYFDTYVFGAIGASPELTLLNNISQGDTASTRTGKKIVVKSIELSATLQSATGAEGFFHCFLLKDKDPNGVACTYADVYDGNSITQLRNMVDPERFTILKSWKYFINGGTAAGELDQSKIISFYKKVNIPVSYNLGNAGTIADIERNALYFVFSCSQAVANASRVFRARIRYTDK